MRLIFILAVLIGLLMRPCLNADVSHAVEIVVRVENTGIYQDDCYGGSRGVVVRAELRNLGTRTISLSMMTCSWFDMWLIRGESGVSRVIWDCAGNYPASLVLEPGQRCVFHIPLVIQNDAQWSPKAIIAVGFRCVEWRPEFAIKGHIPDGGMEVWSNEIELGSLGADLLKSFGTIDSEKGRPEGSGPPQTAQEQEKAICELFAAEKDNLVGLRARLMSLGVGSVRVSDGELRIQVSRSTELSENSVSVVKILNSARLEVANFDSRGVFFISAVACTYRGYYVNWGIWSGVESVPSDGCVVSSLYSAPLDEVDLTYYRKLCDGWYLYRRTTRAGDMVLPGEQRYVPTPHRNGAK